MRETVALVGTAVAGTAIVVLLVLYDVRFIVRVYERSETPTLLAVIAAAAALVATVLGVVWFRRREDGLGRTARRVLGLLAIAWCVLFVIAVVWTHPRNRDEHLTRPVHAGVVAYVVLVVVGAVAFFPYAAFREARAHGTKVAPEVEDPLR